MAIRTPHRVFWALGDQRRLAVLLDVLKAKQIRLKDLAELIGVGEPNLSRQVSALRDRGLLSRGTTQRTDIYVPRPREVRALIRAAALIDFEHTCNPSMQELAVELLRDDMAAGANEPAPSVDPRLGSEPPSEPATNGE